MKKTLVLPIAALGLALAVVSTSPTTSYAQQKPIYGSELMTQPERNEFRAQMRAATSIEAREQIRWEHHVRMLERAKERGITLPDEPPMLGMHQRPGHGDGQGRLRVPGKAGRRGG